MEEYWLVGINRLGDSDFDAIVLSNVVCFSFHGVHLLDDNIKSVFGWEG